MIDSEERVADKARDDATLLLYDFYKHLTTLSLVALGGVLSLSQAGVLIEQRRLALITLLIGAAGVLALMGLDSIVRSRVDGRPVTRTMR
ncbi:MAG: hypothetical protein ACRCY3_12315 [Sphingorhabdus sp.]